VSRTPRGEGVRVGGGRLRVDAARAVTKLREYQLPDPTMWTLEVVRAAVLLGATALYVEADADDVWIGWDGPPLAMQDLTSLFDDLISSGGSERRGQRLLAMGVNTALALDPRFVDLYAIDAESSQRTRYTPRLLVASAEGHSDGLRSLLVEQVPRPDWVLAIQRGSAVHVRRSLSLDTITRALRVDVPPEVHRVLAAATALSIPIHARPRPTPSPPPLVRVALGPGSKHPQLKGHAEIVAVEHASYHARLVWSELGVMLAAEALVMGETREGRRMPIAVQLDSDRLPTNAARSAVREGEPSVDDARRDALAVAKSLAIELSQHVTQSLARGDLGRHHALRAAAIAILHAQYDDRTGWQAFVRDASRDAWYACLLDVPLARDVLGEHRTLRELADANRDVIHRGDAPVRPELATWVSGIPWAPPGDPLHVLYGEQTPKDAGPTIAAAVRRAAARIRFLSHPEIEAQPAMAPGDLCSCALPTTIDGESWVPAGMLEKIDGQVILGAAPGNTERAGAEVIVLVDRRIIHRDRIPCELPLQISISSPELQPNPEYTGMTDLDALERAIEAALWAGVRAAEHLAASRTNATSRDARTTCTLGPAATTTDAATIESTLRAAQRLALRLSGSALSNKRRADAIGALVVRPGPLRDAPLFRPWGQDPLSLAELQRAAHERGVLGTASRQPTLQLGDRMILALRGPDVMALSDLLSARLGEPPARRSKKARARDAERVDAQAWPLEVALVSYGDELAVRAATTGAELASAFRGARAVLVHDGSDFRAALALLAEGEIPRIDLFHAKRRIAGPPRAFLDMHLPVALAIDDDALIPTPGFDELAKGQRLQGPKYDAAAWAERLAHALADHLVGATPPGLVVHDHDRGRLLVTLAELMPDAPSPKDALAERRVRLETLSIVPSLSGLRVPLERLLLAGASALPFVHPETAARVGPLPNFEAAVLVQREAAALGRFFGVSIDDRSAEAQRRFVGERRKRAEAVFLQEPEQASVARPKDSVEVSGAELNGGFARPVASHMARLIVTSKGRPVVEHLDADAGRALEVRVDVELSLIDLDAMDLTPAGTSRVKGAAKDAGRRLLVQMLADDPARIGTDAAWTSLAFAFVDELPRKLTAHRQALLDSLLHAAFIPALDGSLTSIHGALRSPQNEIFFARDLDGWLGPAEGQKPHALDRAPILAFASERDPESERARLARTLAMRVGVLRDVSKEARRLRDARKVARGGGGEARLPPHIDRRFVVSLKTIAQRSQASDTLLEVFPQGEAALLDDGASRLVLIDHSGEETRSYSFVPPVFIVARSPYTQELNEKEAAEAVEAATRTVVAEVLRWTIDTVPSSAWTPAIRKSIRSAALLGGKTHVERISSAAIFPTTKGTFLTYDELRQQVNRFGTIWAVLELSQHEPLDPLRHVLMLAEHERARLDALLPTIDGTLELSLDAQARVNMARPKVSDIAPDAALRASALGIKRVDLGDAELWVAPLQPGSTHARGLMSYRERAPLGMTKDRCRWPTYQQADSANLTPDRVHGAPIEDTALRAIEAAARLASEAVLMERFATPRRAGAFSYLVTDEVSHAVFGGREVEVRGRLEWNGVADPADARVHITDLHGPREARMHATAPKTLVPVTVPLTGELWVSGASYMELPNTQLDGLARRGYIAMLMEAAGEWQSTRSSSEARELALAMLVQGAIGFGVGGLNGKWQSIELSFLRGAATDLKSLGRASRESITVFTLGPDELGAMDQLPEGSLVLVRDGSLPSQVAHTMLGDRTQTLREWVTAQPAYEVPTAGPPTKASAKAAPTTKQKKATPSQPPPVRPAEVMTRRVAALARSVMGTLPPLRVDERRRTTALVFGDDRLVTEESLVRLAADAPSCWTNVVPLIAAEALSVASDECEADLVIALLDALTRE
jgi:hypothetical protein